MRWKLNNSRRRLSRPTVIELFAGAGLWSHAFISEGFDAIRAIEIDRVASATYASNVGSHIETADVLHSSPYGECDVLLAGSPCQGFSTLGRRDANDPRNFLSLDIIRWAKVCSPKIIVVENVEAFLQSAVYNELRSGLELLEYEVVSVLVNALDFGVPQKRIRSFTFATKGVVPELKRISGSTAATVREAWHGLSAEPNGVNLHTSPIPSKLALARMCVIPPGGDNRDVLQRAPELAPPSWKNLRGQVTDVWGRLQWDRPSNTLRTCLQNPSKGRYIHPEQNRTISLREAARIHSIPDSWTFVGLPTQIARQIGNSIPPNVGRSVARAVLSALNN